MFIKIAMENKHNFKLIEGEFTPSEAGKVLFTLVNSKINYHNLEAFSIKERFNGDVSHSERRIEELKSVNMSLTTIINFASEKGLHLKINSCIEITFIE